MSGRATHHRSSWAQPERTTTNDRECQFCLASYRYVEVRRYNSTLYCSKQCSTLDQDELSDYDDDDSPAMPVPAPPPRQPPAPPPPRPPQSHRSPPNHARGKTLAQTHAHHPTTDRTECPTTTTQGSRHTSCPTTKDHDHDPEAHRLCPRNTKDRRTTCTHHSTTTPRTATMSTTTEERRTACTHHRTTSPCSRGRR